MCGSEVPSGWELAGVPTDLKLEKMVAVELVESLESVSVESVLFVFEFPRRIQFFVFLWRRENDYSFCLNVIRTWLCEEGLRFTLCVFVSVCIDLY